METPILNKKQQKQSLSAKKSRPKETIKNVLSTPYSAYWPQISSPEDNSFLKQVLETNLPKIRVETAKIPWRELKHLKKPERREFRRQKTSGQEVDKKECEGLKLGVNAVTKLLESNTATAVLIAGDVQPRLMVQHIIDNAVLYKTPILIFAQLRDTLKDRCGVSSACIAISKNLPSESKLILVKEAVETIFMKCPPPINHINYKRALDSISSETGNVTKESQKPKKLKLDEAIEKTLCLEEVSTKKDDIIMEVHVVTDDFTPFSELNQISTVYKHLKVKRLKGDVNRNKKKITHLKKPK